MTTTRPLAALLFLVAGTALAQAQTPAPSPAAPAQPAAPAAAQPAEPAKADKPKAEKAPVYDEKADGAKQIEAALAKAKKNNRRVLIQWGANWCGWCIQLHNLYKADAKVAKELLYEYDVVAIDVGQFNKHMDLAKKYGADLKGNGLPFLTILDADGKPLANQETSSLEKPADEAVGQKLGHDGAKVLALLKKFEAPRQSADQLLGAALMQARTEDKKVFLHFGAPWCGWCHKLEDWMATPAISPLLAKDFIDCKIDMDRDTGAAEIAKRFRTSEAGGIPWFAFLDGKGAKLIDSDGPKGNTGFPAEPAEIEHFKAMLTKTAKNLTPTDIQALEDSLKPKK